MLRTSIRALQGAASSSSRCFSTATVSARASMRLAAHRRPLAVAAQKRFDSALHNPPDPNDSFLSGSTANYIDEMYLQWKQDPKSVHVSWQVYFKNMESGDMPISQAFTPPPSIVPGTQAVLGLAAGAGVGIGEGADVTNHLKVQLLVRAYQARGHHKSRIDPLGIRNTSKGFGNIPPRSSSSSTTSSPRRISTQSTPWALASCRVSSATAVRR